MSKCAECVWCWTCAAHRTGEGRYMHRADNPVLKHYRCAVCNDVLMTDPPAKTSNE